MPNETTTTTATAAASWSRNPLTNEDWRNFREVYLPFFESGMPRIKAWQKARAELKTRGLRAPSYNSMIRYQRKNNSSEQESVRPAPSEPSALREENATLKTVLRLYRFCREKDRDAVCDLLLPNLCEEQKTEEE